MQINFAKRILTVKIVLYGPAMSGKSSSMRYLREALPAEEKSEMFGIAEGDQTIFFEATPRKNQRLAGLIVRLLVYAVWGVCYLKATRRLLVQGVDGVIFVADSQEGRQDENLESLEELAANLEAQGSSIATIPLVFQWNKRDLPGVGRHERELNRWNAPSFETVATQGQGVLECFHEVVRLVKKDLWDNHLQGSVDPKSGKTLEGS